MTTNQSRRPAAQASADGFNEELTEDAQKTIGELVIWRTTTPDTPFATTEADVGDTTPYVPPVLIPDGTEYMSPGELTKLYRDAIPAAAPERAPQGEATPSTGTDKSATKA